jgi:hypothetical protein
MRFRATAMAIFAVFTLLTTSLAPARAQDSPVDLLPFLDGLESAYARRYDAASMHDHGEPATPDAAATSAATRVEATVLEFETPADALAAFTLLQDDEVVSTLAGLDVSFADFEQVDLGGGGFLFIGPPVDDEVEGILLVLDGNLGLVVTGEGGDPSIEQTLLAFGEFMVQAEPGSGEVVLDGNAGSSGGTWDVLPTAADTDVLDGLVPMYDYDLLVSNSPIEPGATPAS